jgi:hypothetical protein
LQVGWHVLPIGWEAVHGVGVPFAIGFEKSHVGTKTSMTCTRARHPTHKRETAPRGPAPAGQRQSARQRPSAPIDAARECAHWKQQKATLPTKGSSRRCRQSGIRSLRRPRKRMSRGPLAWQRSSSTCPPASSTAAICTAPQRN